MANELRFDGRVAIVTGAGNGLGRSHALLLAARGARVVVNDLGGQARGGGRSSAAADAVVAEIKALGGEAVANDDSVEDGARIVEAALSTWGRVDIVVNNAGILRDASFQKMSQEDWDLIYRVHLLGAFRVTQAAWNPMREAGYGRVLFTSSAAGIYGNFGQANYAAAKLGLVGFANTLAVEGKKRNIHVNTIAPIAGSRLTESVLPKEVTDALKPEYVSPLVAYLCSEECEETGGLYEVGGGFAGRLRWQRSAGKSFKIGRPLTPEAVRSAWSEISDFERVTYPNDVTSAIEPIIANLASRSRGGNEFIDVDAALAAELPSMRSSYDERDLALYALGVGAARDPLDAKELPFVYELAGEGFQALPTFGVVPALKVILEMAREGKEIPGLHYGFERILHGEQYTELKRPLPPHGKLTHKLRVKDIFDKGRNAVVVIAITTTDEAGDELVYNELTMVVRDAGGWGGERGPAADLNAPPDRDPDGVIEERTSENQALLYRLSGDWNPLHADPAFAQAFGFERPILQGLCTFGYAARHVLKTFCGNDARAFKSIRVRFADSVLPGETLVTEMWKQSDTRIVFRTRVKERHKIVLGNAVIDLYSEIPKAAPKTSAAPSAVPAPVLQPVTEGAANGGPTSSDLLAAIGVYLEKNPQLVAQVKTLFQWKLANPNSEWVLDMRSGQGSCVPGVAEKPDCTLALTDADFIAMSTGKADPQQLYFGGKLKISGNVMASQKLEFLKKIDPELVREAMQRRIGATKAPAAASSAQAPVATAPPKQGQSGAIFAALALRIATNPRSGLEVGQRIRFDVRAPEHSWIVDATSGSGSVVAAKGKDDFAVAATFVLDDEDLVMLVKGEATAKDLFQRGKLRVDGDVRLAHTLGFLNGLI